MTELTDAIKTKWDATAGLTSTVTGGLWFGAAPERQALPYCVVDIPSAPRIDGYGAEVIYEPLVNMTVYGVGLKTVGGYADTIVSTFDGVTLTLTGATQVNVTRTDEPLPIHQGWKDANGEEVWGWLVQFRYGVV